MRHRFIAAVFLVAVVPVAHATPRVTCPSSSIDAGVIRADAPSIDPYSPCLVQSDTDWHIGVRRAPAGRQRAVARGVVPSTRSELAIRSVDGSWLPLDDAIPITIAGGPPADAPGIQVAMQLQFSPTADSAPGERVVPLDVLVDGVPAGAQIVVRYTVPPILALVPDARAFQLVASDPSTPNRWTFEPRQYVVTTNVPWALEATINEPAKAASMRTLGDDGLEVAGENGEFHLLKPDGTPVRIASGAPTGAKPLTVTVRLAAVTHGKETEGKYEANVSVRLVAMNAR
jgi:hypothetical protein